MTDDQLEPHKHDEDGNVVTSAKLDKNGYQVGTNVVIHCSCGVPVRSYEAGS